MQQIDKTFFAYQCSVCLGEFEVCKDLLVLELDIPFPICPNCYEGLQTLVKRREPEELYKLLNRPYSGKQATFSKYHPRHYLVTDLVKPGTQTKYTVCNCCGHEVIDRFSKDKISTKNFKQAEKILKLRKDIKKILGNIEIDVCDECLLVIELLWANSQHNTEDFLMKLNTTCKFPPIEKVS